ncbi:signal transduction histidine kinase [Phytophthora cinnamomi]|uniref:signal transduction histidine kinase n=1 Tax=Phytophthora cinnamomi TaxID=4785 RepID=UPI00355A8212|nr:signal transduction histidine kinase [Phytophthora cinnamomi]
MVNYGSLYRPRHRQHKASSASSRPSETPSAASATSAATQHDAQQHWAASSGRSNFSAATADSATPDAYLHFSDAQQDALLLDARANAAALLVDAVADADKWQFVTARGQLRVYELRADAAARVSSMTPADPAQLALNMHTMLATTRVRAPLDDFMRLLASPRRDTFQNVQAALFEERVQLADVFTSFGCLPSERAGRSSSSASSASSGSGSSASGAETEQYAVKYVSIRGRSARSSSGAALNGASANALKFGGKNRHRERQAARLQSGGQGRAAADGAQEEGLTLCLAEYATIRRAHIRGPMAHNQAQDFEDQRVGIISQHSIEDPAVTRYCKPIVTSSAGSGASASSQQQTNFALTARALVQFSGIVVYPVASSVAGDNVLEVLIKFSCYDANGVTSARRQNMLAYLTAFQQLDTALLVMRLRESPYLTSENWVKSRKACGVCQGKFSMSRRKHHCRLCGDVACSKCSEVHQIKLGKAGKCPFRICTNCEHGVDDNQRLSRARVNQGQGAPQPPKTPVGGINALRRRLGSGNASLRGPEDDDEYNRPPSTNSSSGDSSDFYDSRGLLSSQMSTGGGDRTLSSMSGSTVSSFNSSRGLGAFGKSGSSKTLSVSGSSLSGSFYKQSNASNATTISSSRGSRFDYESENDVEGNDVEGLEDRDSEKVVEIAREISREVEKEPEVDQEPALTVDIDAIEATEVASVCSSSPSSPSSVVMQSDQFYKRFSELSLMDFHDSEFDLSLKGGLPAAGSRFTTFDFHDSEADADSDREDLGGIGEEDDEDGDGDEDDICDFDLRELDEADEDDGMEFHDSNVGIDFKLQDLNLQDYQGLDELEEADEDFDEEVVEEIHTDMVLGRSRVGASLDEERAARLAEYGIMDSAKEHIYDLVAKQAAQHTSCSVATISFVDAQREFIKSSFGVAVMRDLSEIPISHSLTAEIMRRFPARKPAAVHDVTGDDDDDDDDEMDDGEVVTVLNALQDDVLSTNLFVTEAPNVRFIMGVPFRARDGIVLGALIVADSKPRSSVPSRQRSQLKDLAEQVSALLEDLWTRTQERAHLASSQTGQLRDQLVDLLSQSYTTGLQMQQNELKIKEQSTSNLSSSMHKPQTSSNASSSAHQPQYAKDFRHMQSVEL